MEIKAEIMRMEGGLAKAGATARALCDRAGVNQSTWTRWKSGATAPNLSTWGRVQSAYAELTAEASTPPSDAA